jgi:SAM-dependent methyltransferase
MICPVCGNNSWSFERRYNELDKYEKWGGIVPPICRAWYVCDVCELRKVRHSYPVEKLMHVYSNGYRAEAFRGRSIEDEFSTIIAKSKTESENKRRVDWVAQFIKPSELLLDVGPGIGVFQYELMKKMSVYCKAVEPNKDSVRFIRSLGVDCKHGFYEPLMFEEAFDWITCVHVLEHAKDPEAMLMSFRQDLMPDGKIFIEVPNALEFNTLLSDHDEFNSMHMHFFTPACLHRLVESCGYYVTDMKMVTTVERHLHRIMMVANANR